MELLQKTALQDRLRNDVNDLLGSTDERARNVTPAPSLQLTILLQMIVTMIGTARPSSGDIGNL